MSANPYERRRVPRVDEGLIGFPPMRATGRGPDPSPLLLEDLEAIAYRAEMRGRAQEQRRGAEREQGARRAAWDEGHEAGMRAGHKELLREIDDRCGELVRTIHQKASEVLKRAGEEPKRVTKDELERMLDTTVDTLARLIDAHHHEFVEIPF